MALLVILLTIIVFSFLIFATTNIRSGVYVKAYSKGVLSERVVALTFDDGPEQSITNNLLDILSREQVKAAFFCIGEKAENNIVLIKRISNDGHLIGAHSYRHKIDLTYCTRGTLKADLSRCVNVLQAATGKKINWYRPPYGVTNPIIGSVSRELRLNVAGWSVRSFDTVNRDQDKVLRRILKKVRPGSVILLHDRMPFAPMLTMKLIKELKARGYSFERFDRLIAI